MSRGMSRELASFIFSGPMVTSTPAAMAARAPSPAAPVRSRRASSHPASIAATEENAAMNTPVFTVVPEGISPLFPAERKSASGTAMKSAASAVQKGEVSPKNRAISFPEANPAPITVPM